MIWFGAFEAMSPLGQGGMGQVWRGRHGEQGVPVAIKVLSSRVARDPSFRDGFTREVQAMAALDHPGICHIFDYGVIDEQAASQPLAQQEKLKAGDPWLAMELAPHGSLDQQQPMRSWTRLRRCLLEILDALAHAHARGIVHRDLKPGNVLICEDEQGQRRYVLTDFGLAHALDPTVSSSTADIHASMAGTPHYMPPEQIQGHWRDYGPWTDLYALGCMAYELACGQPPFHADNFIRLAAQHLDAEPPALQPRFKVPDALEGWVHRLMAKDWTQRFVCAADAAWALMQLELELDDAQGEAEEADEAEGEQGRALPTLYELAMTMESGVITGATMMLDRTQLDELAVSDQHHARARPARLFDSQLVDEARVGRAPHALGPRPASALDMPPLPPSWRLSEGQTRRSPRLIGAGLGLFGLREGAFVGRQQERDRLWAALAAAQGERRCQVIVVRGPAGAGKTRLVEWLGCRAAELGAAQLLRANHQTIPGPMHGLTPALQAALHTINLSRRATFERVVSLLGRLDPGASAQRQRDAALVITELAAPDQATPADGLPPVMFSSPAERHAALCDLFGRLCKLRPVLLWLDDVQWGEESLAFVESLHKAALELPMVVVLTAREEALDALPAARARLGRLTGAETIALEPLEPAEHEALVEDMLTLDPRLAAQLTQRTQGNPLFVRQLLSDWVERGLLVAGPSGFTLREASSVALPASIQAVWRARLDHLEAEAPGTLFLLELAATLGQEVRQRELDALCRQVGARLPAELEDRLIGRGLAQRRAGGWAFAHGMLHESLLALAEESGRLEQHHRAAAAMLARSPEAMRPETLERRGKHLMAARAWEDATGALWGAMVGYHRTSAYTRALGALDLRDAALDALGAGEEDARRVWGWPYRAELHRFVGNMQESVLWAERAIAATEATPESTPRADALRTRATLLWAMGEPQSALALNLQAQGIYRRLHDHHGLVQALHGHGWVMMALRRYPEALETFKQGAQLAADISDQRNQAWCLQGIADLYIRLRQPDRGEGYARQAEALFLAVGSRTGAALSRSALADTMRQRGQLDAAREEYIAARELWRETGSSLMSLASFRIALVQLEQGRVGETQAMFEELSALAQLNNFLLLLGKILCALSIAAYARDAARWDEQWAQLEQLSQARIIDHADVIDAMALCERLWQQARDARRAAQAAALGAEISAAVAEGAAAL